jgi:pyocin large subunit-like protein
MNSLRRIVSSSLLLCVLLACSACRATNSPVSQQQNPAASPVASAPRQEVAINRNVGFSSRQKWLDHFDKHGYEFGDITADEYLRQAQTLRDSAVNANILESVRRDGVVTRFDKQAGTFLAFNPDLTIRTYFKPNDGANYFWRQSKR